MNRNINRGRTRPQAAPRSRVSTQARLAGPGRSVAQPTFRPLAEMTAAIAPAVLHAVFQEHRRLAPALTGARRARRNGCQGSLLDDSQPGLAHAVVGLDRAASHARGSRNNSCWPGCSIPSKWAPMARVWAARIGRHPDRLVPVGDAPNWTGRAEGLKRWTEGRPVNADPWRLFPAWMRDQLPVPPGDATPKVRKLDFLAALQARPPLWVAVRGQDEKSVWAELRDAGLKPWIHRRIPTAARLPPETDLTAFESFRSGQLIAHDIASQAVAIVCDPDPGERWWDVNGDNGLHSLHLAALMKGKGLVVCTFEQERRRESDRAQAAQQSAFTTSRPGSGTAGTWPARREPTTECWSTRSPRASEAGAATPTRAGR